MRCKACVDRLPWAALGLLLACGDEPRSGEADSGEADSDSSGDFSSATASGTNPYGTSSSSTAAEPTDSSEGPEGSSTDDPSAGGVCEAAAPSACEPAPSYDESAVISYINNEIDVPDELDDIECTVLEILPTQNRLTFVIDCPAIPDEDPYLGMPAPPEALRMAAVAVGDVVRVTQQTRFVPYVERWLTLRDAEGHLLGGTVDAFDLVRPDTPDLFAPLMLDVVDGLCADDCYELAPSFLAKIRRVAVEFVSPTGSAEVVDGTRATWGDHGAIVDLARLCVEGQWCAEVTDQQFRLFVYDATPP